MSKSNSPNCRCADLRRAAASSAAMRASGLTPSATARSAAKICPATTLPDSLPPMRASGGVGAGQCPVSAPPVSAPPVSSDCGTADSGEMQAEAASRSLFKSGGDSLPASRRESPPLLKSESTLAAW
eukprot:CAMPEP_0179901234 /NCGR_PEP_ID=MMETSP0982-20121206/39643_1 /TAXON_ID=483367 /ORGANISM="non described non described, Strain CCMP 2436" /LENGTH=126 /DNA_ID=CAMNT_0021799743 /DNA_START=84 /DNA_END=461 /DNA_ORIENTATION=-